jgi:hypothetical protein
VGVEVVGGEVDRGTGNVEGTGARVFLHAYLGGSSVVHSEERVRRDYVASERRRCALLPQRPDVNTHGIRTPFSG